MSSKRRIINLVHVSLLFLLSSRSKSLLIKFCILHVDTCNCILVANFYLELYHLKLTY